MKDTANQLKVESWVVNNSAMLAKRYIYYYEWCVKKGETIVQDVIDGYGTPDPDSNQEADQFELTELIEEAADRDSEILEAVDKWQKNFNHVAELIPTYLPHTKAMSALFEADV